MSEMKIKTYNKNKKNFGYKKFGATGRREDGIIPKKPVDNVSEYNTQKTTDESDYEQRRVNSLLHVIFKICELSGFWVEERIVLKDRKTGKIWR